VCFHGGPIAAYSVEATARVSLEIVHDALWPNIGFDRGVNVRGSHVWSFETEREA